MKLSGNNTYKYLEKARTGDLNICKLSFSAISYCNLHCVKGVRIWSFSGP